MSFRPVVILLAVFLLCARSLAAQDTTNAPEQFKQKCILCHGADGRAHTALGRFVGAFDLTSEKVQSQSDAQLRDVITHGKGKMAAYGSVLGPKGVNAMVKYVRTFGKKKK